MRLKKTRGFVMTTFASKSLAPAMERLTRQASSMGIFDDIIQYDETMLDDNFRARFKFKLSESIRGFGYWCWKPQVAFQALDRVRDGDVLLYLDAGCHLNSQGKRRLEEYVDMLSPETPILAFKYNGSSNDDTLKTRAVPQWTNDAWTKEDLFATLGVGHDAPLRTDQTYHATAFMLLNVPLARKFLSEWIEVFTKDWAMIDDSPSVLQNGPLFKEHRHDQSIFSILCNRYPVVSIDAREIICLSTNQKKFDWNVLSKYPIHARRDRDLPATKRGLKRFDKLKQRTVDFCKRSWS